MGEVYDAVRGAVGRPGVLDRVVGTVGGGEQRIEDLIAFNVVDSTVHSWDLARATGVDDRLDPALVRRCLDLALPVAAELRASGAVGQAVAAPAADDQTALLAALGRRA